MALLHATNLTPTKLELLSEWMPQQPWFAGGELEQIGSFRLDDPAGEVGIEGLIMSAGGRTYHVPMTYRAAPLEGGRLVGTMLHGVLGERWAYDATSDPTYVGVLAATILTGGRQADLVRELADGSREDVQAVVTVEGSGLLPDPGEIGLVDVRDDGDVTTVVTSIGEVLVRRVIDPVSGVLGDLELTGMWPGADEPTVLAAVRLP